MVFARRAEGQAAGHLLVNPFRLDRYALWFVESRLPVLTAALFGVSKEMNVKGLKRLFPYPFFGQANKGYKRILILTPKAFPCPPPKQNIDKLLLCITIYNLKSFSESCAPTDLESTDT